jgi:hypothetical protein
MEVRADQPGAADFYYGEMQMRRFSGNRGRAEQFVVWLYWALSGYGLRASRALAALLILLTAGTLTLQHVGFRHASPSFDRATILALRAMVPGMSSDELLTVTGNVVEVSLRVMTPIFAALFILALRNRVKR